MKKIYVFLLGLILCLNGCVGQVQTSTNTATNIVEIEKESDISLNDVPEYSVSLDNIPEYNGTPYIEINNNIPYFTESDLTVESYESYSELDALGRCGTAMACVGKDLMPTEDRESISEIKPSGWINKDYGDLVDGGYLYNRCHLIGFQLTGENANEKNLITGTRYMNTEGMLPFENMVADYIKETNNHVLYRVTPIFDSDNLVANGVLMEARSIEDDEILFNVYCYNVQPGVTIDYETGDNWEDNSFVQETEKISNEQTNYILNTNTMKFHYPNCNSVQDMNKDNKEEYTGTRDELINKGYSPCGNCNP